MTTLTRSEAQTWTWVPAPGTRSRPGSSDIQRWVLCPENHTWQPTTSLTYRSPEQSPTILKHYHYHIIQEWLLNSTVGNCFRTPTCSTGCHRWASRGWSGQPRAPGWTWWSRPARMRTPASRNLRYTHLTTTSTRTMRGERKLFLRIILKLMCKDCQPFLGRTPLVLGGVSPMDLPPPTTARRQKDGWGRICFFQSRQNVSCPQIIHYSTRWRSKWSSSTTSWDGTRPSRRERLALWRRYFEKILHFVFRVLC